MALLPPVAATVVLPVTLYVPPVSLPTNWMLEPTTVD